MSEFSILFPAVIETAANSSTTPRLFIITGRLLTASKVDEHLFQSRLADGIIIHQKLAADLFHGGKQSRQTDRRRAWNVVLHKAVMDVFECGAWEQLLNVMPEWCNINMTRRIAHNFGYERVAIAKLALHMLWTTEALELSVDHDCNTRTQCIAFLHAAI